MKWKNNPKQNNNLICFLVPATAVMTMTGEEFCVEFKQEKKANSEMEIISTTLVN